VPPLNLNHSMVSAEGKEIDHEVYQPKESYLFMAYPPAPWGMGFFFRSSRPSPLSHRSSQ